MPLKIALFDKFACGAYPYSIQPVSSFHVKMQFRAEKVRVQKKVMSYQPFPKSWKKNQVGQEGLTTV
jgi:hypothetical protein